MENSRSSTERTVLANAIPIDVPYVVGFWTGDVCNFKCKYCIHSLEGDIYNKNSTLQLLRCITLIPVHSCQKIFPCLSAHLTYV